MDGDNLYEVLGLEPGASREQVERQIAAASKDIAESYRDLKKYEIAQSDRRAAILSTKPLAASSLAVPSAV